MKNGTSTPRKTAKSLIKFLPDKAYSVCVCFSWRNNRNYSEKHRFWNNLEIWILLCPIFGEIEEPIYLSARLVLFECVS